VTGNLKNFAKFLGTKQPLRDNEYIYLSHPSIHPVVGYIGYPAVYPYLYIDMQPWDG
jgi:hypothetical protein